MDLQKKKRTAQRSAFTKALNGFDLAVSSREDRNSIAVKWNILERKMDELNITSGEIVNLMFTDPTVDDKAIQDEYAAADEYLEKFYAARIKYEGLSARPSNNMPQNSNAGEIIYDRRSSYRLPKIELVKFGGEVREWLQFWSPFKKIDEDQSLDKEDKFQYLLQAMVPRSRAEELVKSFPPTAENYDKAITSLKNRFGRKDLQIEVYIRAFLQLVMQNTLKPAKEIGLSSLYDQIESHLRSLESLGVTTDKDSAILVPLVESSLPEYLLRAWQRSTKDVVQINEDGAASQTPSRLNQLVRFLENEVQNELRISMAVKGFNLSSTNDVEKAQKDKKEKKHQDVPNATGLFAAKGASKTCIFCDKGEHESANCEQAKKLSRDEKQETIKRKNACFNCLNVGHSFRKCRVYVKCGWCHKRHQLVMCPQLSTKNSATAEEPKNEVAMASICRDPQVFLQTLRVKMFNGEKETFARVIIDTGSQKSYVTKEAAARVGYEPIEEQLMTHSLFGGQKSDTVKHKKYKIHLCSLNNQFRCNFDVLDQAVISDDVPAIKPGVWCEELSALDITLTDMSARDESVSILIGADIAGKLLTGKRHKLKCGLVVVETYLGWTVMGAASGVEPRTDATLIATSLFASGEKVSDLWSLDALGIKDPIEKKTQAAREKIMTEAFLKTVLMNEEGRYEVKLPWIENHPAIGTNKNAAERRLQSTVRKLKADNLYEAYDAVFKEWLSEGIIEYVPEEERTNWGHYLPHRHVVKEGSTTRIRPVFDASAKERDFPSLNECLEKGPNLIELVASILLRFREGNLGVISDIKKAFLQISIDEKDRDFLRFLWVDREGKNVEFRHCRVVFGVSSSPFILGAVISMHLNKILASSEKGQATSENIIKLKNSVYVDNCVASLQSEKDLNCFMADAKAAMDSAGFDLRGWEHTRDNSKNPRAAVLGVIWDKQQDALMLNVPCVNNIAEEKITKRSIVSLAHRVFDPLGLVSPAILCPRVLLQQAWAQKVSWDEEVCDDIKEQFLKWAKGLDCLEKISVPRHFLGPGVGTDDVTLHTFCDASKLAFAAVIFIRFKTPSGYGVRFVQSKTRVAPSRKENSDARQSIPRLELLAATIGARLTASVLTSLQWDNVKIYYWSDSTTVLAWIRRENNWATFVYNRVKEIKGLSGADQWRHVPGHLNPADLPSRGCTADQLLKSRWWEGPEWLRSGEEDWPMHESACDENEVVKEMRKTSKRESNITVLFAAGNKETDKDTSWNDGIAFSSYNKTKRVVSWIYRFYFNAKNKVESRKKGCLSHEELRDAELKILRAIQIESFDGIGDARTAVYSRSWTTKGFYA